MTEDSNLINLKVRKVFIVDEDNTEKKIPFTGIISSYNNAKKCYTIM
jgi:hypothetical protein